MLIFFVGNDALINFEKKCAEELLMKNTELKSLKLLHSEKKYLMNSNMTTL